MRAILTSLPANGDTFSSVLVLGIAATVYSTLHWGGLQNSAALYIGLPLMLALGISLTPKTRSALGATMKGITIALLLAIPVFREGYICILFASPIFYIVGALIGAAIDYARRRRSRGAKLQTAAVTGLLTLLSLEGTTEITTIAREKRRHCFRIINASIEDIRLQMAKTPHLGDNKPLFLRIFPYPAAIAGSGLNLGDERRIHLRRPTSRSGGTVSRAISFLNVAESTPRKDQIRHSTRRQLHQPLSHMAVLAGRARPLADGRTRVTCTLSYSRRLDPLGISDRCSAMP